jgi:hypothetical protein
MLKIIPKTSHRNRLKLPLLKKKICGKEKDVERAMREIMEEQFKHKNWSMLKINPKASHRKRLKLPLSKKKV